jgi:thymidylate synthase
MYLSTDGSYENIYDETDQTVIDQISILINDLKTNPDSRRLMVNAWNVADVNNGSMVLPPCHYGFQLYTRELTGEERWDLLKERVGGHKFQLMVDDIVPFGGGLSEELQSYNIPKRAISLMWNQRSVDTFLGLPFNIASYGLLLEIIAKSVNMVSDELIGNLGDVHLYKNHIEQAKEQIDREPFKLPKLNINTEFWPTEGGECGIGLIDAKSVFEGFTNEHFCKCLLEDDIQLYDYQSHPTIKAPLSN